MMDRLKFWSFLTFVMIVSAGMGIITYFLVHSGDNTIYCKDLNDNGFVDMSQCVETEEYLS